MASVWRLLAFVPCFGFAGWDVDPLAWRIREKEIACLQSGFALADAACGREVVVSARVTPQTCERPGWATIGVSVRDDDRNFWHLALVKHPDQTGAQRSFELAMMMDGEWPVQGRLKCLEFRANGRWEFGQACDLRLTMTRQGVRGEVTDAATGRCLYRCGYAFSARAADKGSPALRVTGDLKGIFADVKWSVRDEVPRERRINPIVPYPRDSSTNAVSRATGFFRVEEKEGRWRAVDPNGAPFTVLGVDHVQPWGMFCESLGYSPYGRHVKAHYRDFEAWADETVERLKAWGFNALGAGSDFARLGHRGLIHTVFLNMGDRLCYGDGEWWIRECLHAPCTAFPNVFHPDFERACDHVARQKCAANGDDPWLFGYFIDNELSWWGSGGLAEGMFNAVNEKPDVHTAKQALKKFLNGRPVTAALKREFLELVADRYFAVTTAAIRRYDPHHLILGCRFAGLDGAHEIVWRTAARYCDVVTFNMYPWADLDRNVVLDRKGGVPVREKFDALAETVNRPMLLTEWSFPALDTGRPCYHGAGQRFATQDLRVQATELFAKTLLALPYFIGYDYFMWVDQPAPGMNHLFQEDSNYGLVMEDGTPHKGITSMFAALHRDTERWRVSGLPKPRDYIAPTAVSERERFLAAAKGPAEAVKFVREGTAWTLANDAGLSLSGRTEPGGDMVASVVLDGRRYGSFGGLVELVKPEGHVWVDARDVKEVRFVREGVCGSVVLSAEGGDAAHRFEITLRCMLAPGCRRFASDIVSVRNLGETPLDIARLFMRPFAAERPEGTVPSVPNLWKGPAESAWQFKDGAKYGIRSGDGSVSFFNLWLNEGGGQHPDAAFVPPQSLRLRPGATFTPPRPMSAVVFAEGRR